MVYIDNDARVTSRKALTVIFIIIIIFVNAIYLFTRRQVTGIFSRAGVCVRMTLAIGSIFLALFSLVVQARFLFDDYRTIKSMKCSTTMTAVIYQSFFFPFVFGLGLVLQALDIGERSRRLPLTEITYPGVRAFIYAAIPWLCGLLIVCPLTMAGMDWDGCNNDSMTLGRSRAAYWVCVILPACGAVFCGFVVAFLLKSTPSHQHGPTNIAMTTAGGYPATTTSGVILNTNVGYQWPTPSAPGQTLPSSGDQQPAQANPEPFKSGCDGGGGVQPGYNSASAPNQYPGQAHPQPYGQMPPAYPQQPLPPSQPAGQGQWVAPPPYAYAQAQQQQTTVMQTGPAPPILGQPVITNSGAVLLDEKRGLFHASLIFLICILPMSCLTLGYYLNTEHDKYIDRDVITILTDTFYWLSLIYPVLIPFVWLKMKMNP